MFIDTNQLIGIGPRIKVTAVGSAVASSSGAAVASSSGAPNITSCGLTYPTSNTPQASGYSNSHPKYPEQHSHWSGIASGGTRRVISGPGIASGGRRVISGSATPVAAGDMREEVVIKVSMGVVMQGSNRINQIGVSHSHSVFIYVLNRITQDCLEGLDQIDAHIGGGDLHQVCYDVLQKKWLAWSKGHVIHISKTTLRGTKIFAAISGRGLVHPAKERDAIWHFVFKKRGKATKPTFKVEQLELSVVLDYEDFHEIELYCNNHQLGDASMIQNTTPGHVSKIGYTVISISYIPYSRTPLCPKTWNQYRMTNVCLKTWNRYRMMNVHGYRMGMMKWIQIKIKDQNSLG